MKRKDLCKTLEALAEKICTKDFPNYKVISCLGAGASAAVYKIIENQGDGAYALKVYDPKFLEGASAIFEKERIQLQAQIAGMGHPNLIKILSAGFSHDTAYITMELLGDEWVSLDKAIGKIPSEQIENLIACVAKAAKHLFDNGITHRDIKPANIMIKKDFTDAILLDLGVAKAFSKHGHGDEGYGGNIPFVATVRYSSPEYLFGLMSYTKELWEALTLYQLGAVLYEMLYGISLFDKESKRANKYVLAYAVLFTEPEVVTSREVSDRLAVISRKALHKDWKRRRSQVGWGDFIEGKVEEELVRERLGLSRAVKDVKTEPVQANFIFQRNISELREELKTVLFEKGHGRVSIEKNTQNGSCHILNYKAQYVATSQIGVEVICSLHDKDREIGIAVRVDGNSSGKEAFFNLEEFSPIDVALEAEKLIVESLGCLIT